MLACSTRRLSLTSAGAAYLEKCRVILSLVENAEADLAGERQVLRGPIRLSLPLSFGVRHLAPLLLEFATEHPEVNLNADYSEQRSNLFAAGYRPATATYCCKRRSPVSASPVRRPSSFPQAELGIHALLPGNRLVPQRVRALMDFLVERIGLETAWHV